MVMSVKEIKSVEEGPLASRDQANAMPVWLPQDKRPSRGNKPEKAIGSAASAPASARQLATDASNVKVTSNIDQIPELRRRAALAREENEDAAAKKSEEYAKQQQATLQQGTSCGSVQRTPADSNSKQAQLHLHASWTFKKA